MRTSFVSASLRPARSWRSVPCCVVVCLARIIVALGPFSFARFAQSFLVLRLYDVLRKEAQKKIDKSQEK